MLAISDTGMSHRLSIMRGVLMGSLVMLQPLFLYLRLLDASSVVPVRSKRDVCAVVVFQTFFMGAVQTVAEMPIIKSRRVNILSLRLTLVHLWLIRIIGQGSV